MVDKSSLGKRNTSKRSNADSDSDFEVNQPAAPSKKQVSSTQKRQRTISINSTGNSQSSSQAQDNKISVAKKGKSKKAVKVVIKSKEATVNSVEAPEEEQVTNPSLDQIDQADHAGQASQSSKKDKKAPLDSSESTVNIVESDVGDQEQEELTIQTLGQLDHAYHVDQQSSSPLSSQSSLPTFTDDEEDEEDEELKLTIQTLDQLDRADRVDQESSSPLSSQSSLPSFTDDDEEEEEDDEHDGVDWESIELPPIYDDMPEPPQRVYNDVVLTYKVTRTTIKKTFWEQAYERSVREWTHNAHIVLLVAHYKLRNNWCCSSDIKDICLSIIPENTKRLLLKDSKERTLVTGIKWLMDWWHSYFTLTGPGLTSKSVSDYKHLLDMDLMAVAARAGNEGEWDKISDFQDFQRILMELKKGTRDTCAELFVALLRACECETRLVCSLQPISYKAPNSKAKAKPKQDQDQEEGDEVGESSKSRNVNHNNEDDEQEEEGEKQELLFPFRPSMRPSVDYDKLAKSNKAKPPIIWAEVYCSDTKRWICIDPIRKYIDQPLLMEPAQLNKENHLSLVLGIDDQGHCTDVTRRYTLHMERAMRLRERPLTVREKQQGHTLWSDLFLNILCHLRPTKKNRNKMERKQKEEQELDHHKVANERMPSSLDGFKNHPIYALERHLKKFEVMYPKQPVLGSFKGEKVYPRSSVKTVCTAETWKKLGKVIKAAEVPVKHVVSRAVTLEKKRLKEQARQQGKELTVPCYGEWQTVSYQSEPVIDGKVPKNGFGNIDLFTAEMLPKGAAHIPIKGIGKIAKQLDIDYADAVVDFEFVKMRSVPVIDGIVVAEEYKDTLLKVWNECELERINKAIAKQEKQVNLRWRKLIKGLLIKARIDEEYKKADDTAVTWSKGGEDYLAGGGGFLPE